MGFWQGINEGLTYVMEDKARKKELEAARQERIDERQANLNLEETRYKRELAQRETEYKRNRTDSWADSLVKLQVQKELDDRTAKTMTAGAKSFIDKLGDSNPELSAALAANPSVAAALEEQRASAEMEAKKHGLAFPYQGETLANMINWSSTGEATLAPPPPINLTPQTQEEYVQSVATLATPSQPTIAATLNADVFFVPNPDNLKKGEELVDTKVLDLANQKLKSMGEDAEGYAELKNKIDQYSTADSAGRIELQKEFGLPAYQEVVGMNNIYTQGIDKSPRFTDFANITYLQSVIAAQDSTQDEKTRAAKLLADTYSIVVPTTTSNPERR